MVLEIKIKLMFKGWLHGGGFLDTGKVHLKNLSVGFMGVFTLRKFINLYTQDLYNFLYVYNTLIKHSLEKMLTELEAISGNSAIGTFVG